MAIAAQEPLGVIAGALAPGDLVPRDANLAVVEAEGTKVVAAYRVEARERERRVQGMPPLTRPDALNLLMALPHGEFVPAASLNGRNAER